MIYIVYFYLAWSSVAEYFVKAGIPAVSYIDELLALVLFIHLLLGKPKGVSTPVPVYITKRVWVILGISFLSMLVNMASPLGALQFIFSILKPIILFYWVIKFTQDDQLMHFAIKWLIFIILIQVPFVVYGLLTSGFTGYTGDFATGATITGDAFQLAVYMWLGSMFSIAYFFSKKEKKYLVFLGLCFSILILTSTKQITFLFPFVVIFLLRKQLRLTLTKIIIFASVILIIGETLFNFVETIFVRNYGVEQSDSDYFAAVEGSEKIQGYYSAIYELPGEIPVPLLGAGPGQYGSYVGMNARTPLSKKYIMDYSDLIPFGFGGTLTYRSSGLIGIYGDIGIVGLIVLLSIYFSTIGISLNYAKGATLPFDKASAFLATASGILIVLESVMQNIFEGNWFLLNLFWVMSGCVVLKQIRSQNIIK